VQVVHIQHGGGTTPPSQVGIRPAQEGCSRPYTRSMANRPRPDAYSEIARGVGRRIRWARELVEPNRAEFARSMGVDRSTIRDIESGRRPPSIFSILEISHRLRITPDYILLGRMRGIDGELAALLGHLHPELIGPEPSSHIHGRDDPESTSRMPTKLGRSHKKA
jgi:transcriptional regulator with XRE-family HTH domain